MISDGCSPVRPTVSAHARGSPKASISAAGHGHRDRGGERVVSLTSGLHRDAGQLRRALVPESRNRRPPWTSRRTGHGSSISEVVTAAAQTTLRPSAVGVGELEPAIVDATADERDHGRAGRGARRRNRRRKRGRVDGSVQPEGYHFVADVPIGMRRDELAQIAEALRDREPGRLPFGLRVACRPADKPACSSGSRWPTASRSGTCSCPPTRCSPRRLRSASPPASRSSRARRRRRRRFRVGGPVAEVIDLRAGGSDSRRVVGPPEPVVEPDSRGRRRRSR